MRTVVASAILFSLVLGLTVALALAPQEETGGHPGIEETENAGRFEAIEIFVDSGAEPLAAYQFDFRAVAGNVKIVGIESGEHDAFAGEPPYYDPAAMMHDRVIVGNFSLRDAGALPAGKTRVTTIHIMIEPGEEPRFELSLDTAATVDGRRINANVSFKRGLES